MFLFSLLMLYVSVWIHIRVCVSMFSLLFFFLVAVMDFSSMNSAPVHCSRDLKNSLFSNFFIKNGSHGTIYTFKNYFAIVFSVFSKNKLYPNGPSLSLSLWWCFFYKVTTWRDWCVFSLLTIGMGRFVWRSKWVVCSLAWVVPLRLAEVVVSCLVLVWWWFVGCGWFGGLWVAGFCMLWSNGVGVGCVMAVALV